MSVLMATQIKCLFLKWSGQLSHFTVQKSNGHDISSKSFSSDIDNIVLGIVFWFYSELPESWIRPIAAVSTSVMQGHYSDPLQSGVDAKINTDG